MIVSYGVKIAVMNAFDRLFGSNCKLDIHCGILKYIPNLQLFTVSGH